NRAGCGSQLRTARGPLLADTRRQKRREELPPGSKPRSAFGEFLPWAGKDLPEATEVCGRPGRSRRCTQGGSRAHRCTLHSRTSAAPLRTQTRSEEGVGCRRGYGRETAKCGPRSLPRTAAVFAVI